MAFNQILLSVCWGAFGGHVRAVPLHGLVGPLDSDNKKPSEEG